MKRIAVRTSKFCHHEHPWQLFCYPIRAHVRRVSEHRIYEERERDKKMPDKREQNNQATIQGKIVSPFTFSHEKYGERFYLMDVFTKRLSNSSDRIPVIISGQLVDVTQDCTGEFVRVSGQFRSYNRHGELRNRLLLAVFAREITFLKGEPDRMETNTLLLKGYLCKPPVYRKTPLGREITDLLIAVNRSYGRSDYLPCICWGRTARYASNLTIGTYVSITGRIQSREYIKKLTENLMEKRVAYEVSIIRMECPKP